MMLIHHGLLWNRTAADFSVLATAMLADMKEQARVDHTRDDNIIMRHTAWAISTVEKRANINLHPCTFRSGGYTTALWGAPCVCPLPGAMGYRLPFNNVRALRLLDGATDVTGDWVAVQAMFGANAEAYAVSPTNAGAPGGAVIELDVGVDDFTKLDPVVVQVVQRFAASAYEHREANIDLSEAGFESELFGIWRPTA